MAEDNHNSTSSARCYKHQAEDGPSLLQNGNLTIQAHHVGWIIASFFTIVATAVSFWLVSKHLKWYTNKREQRYIVRILFMVPIYAIISLASYFFWDHATPLILLRDCYESTVLTSFFYLLLIYISPDPEEQRAIFRKVGLSREADNIAIQNREPVKKWMFPLGFVKSKPADGLYFLQAMKWGVLQYCVLRPATTLAAIVLDYIGLYCETSWSPGWGHIYLVLIVSLSVTIAMYCLFQLYMVSKEYLAPQRPLLKLFAIKAVVFLTFWQATFLGVLAMFGVVKDTRYMTADDINIGIGALLETFEMMLFAFLHVKAFTYKVYKPVRHDLPPLQTNRLRALGHAMDFRETFRELWAGCVYMWAKMRGREPKVDVGAKRQGYYEGAFGRARPGPSTSTPLVTEKDAQEDARDVTFPSLRTDADRRMDVGGQREWLGAGNHYGYGIYREKSDGLEAQIEMELARRGYGHNRTEIAGKRGNIRPPTEDGTGHPRQRSWWRSLYSRVSQSTDHDYEQESRLSPSPSRQVRESQRRSSRRSLRYGSRDREVERNLVADHRHEIDDPPPPSLIRKYRASSQQRQQSQYEDIYQRRSPPVDVLSPLSVYNEHRMSQMERQQRRHTPPPAQMPSPLAGSRPLSPPVLSSSPPPTSLLLAPAAQHPNLSNDTLLGRVFPSKSDLLSSTEHSHGGFMTSPPPSAEHGYSIGMAGERRVVQSHGSPPAPGRMELVATHNPHREGNTRHSPSPPSRPTVDLSPPSQPSSSRGLRRSSAQVYSPPQRASRMYPHRQSLPAPVQVPQPGYMAHGPPSSRRRSTPMILTVPAPLAPPSASQQAGRSRNVFNEDRMESTLAQPSYSGTTDVGKYPDPSVIGSPDIGHLRAGSNGRYPGLPSATRSPGSPASNNHFQYTNHHFPSSGSPTNDNYEPSKGYNLRT